MSEKIVANLAETKVGDHFDFDSEDVGEQLKRQSIMSEMLAGRMSSNWRDYCNTGKGLGGTHDDRSKRVRRYLLVAKAIDALEDVPVQEES